MKNIFEYLNPSNSHALHNFIYMVYTANYQRFSNLFKGYGFFPDIEVEYLDESIMEYVAPRLRKFIELNKIAIANDDIYTPFIVDEEDEKIANEKWLEILDDILFAVEGQVDFFMHYRIAAKAANIGEYELISNYLKESAEYKRFYQSLEASFKREKRGLEYFGKYFSSLNI